MNPRKSNSRERTVPERSVENVGWMEIKCWTLMPAVVMVVLEILNLCLVFMYIASKTACQENPNISSNNTIVQPPRTNCTHIGGFGSGFKIDTGSSVGDDTLINLHCYVIVFNVVAIIIGLVLIDFFKVPMIAYLKYCALFYYLGLISNICIAVISPLWVGLALSVISVSGFGTGTWSVYGYFLEIKESMENEADRAEQSRRLLGISVVPRYSLYVPKGLRT